MKRFVLLMALSGIAFCGLAPIALTQEVDFEIPTEINIIQGRLSVVFNDNVQERTAHDLIASLGYDILQSAFEPRYVYATAARLLDEEEISQIEEDPRVLSFSQSERPNRFQSTGKATPNGVDIEISFQSRVTQAEATVLLRDHPAITISHAKKRPNEIVIEVGDQDEMAFTLLEGREEVRWVTYVGVAGNG